MKIAIIGAMEQEVVLLRAQLTSIATLNKVGYEVYNGKLFGAEVALVKSGIGKVSAALSTTLLLDHFKPEYVINTGSAGSLVPFLNIGDVVVSNEVGYHDVDVTAFGYKPGQMAQCPVTFRACPFLVTLAEDIIRRLGMHAVLGLIVSGDIFINDAASLVKIHKNFPNAVGVEMEATAIAHVCYAFSVPFIVIRAISDIADKKSHLNFKEFITITAQISSYLVMKMVQSLTNYQ